MKVLTILLVLACTFLSGCKKSALKSEKTANSEIEVDFLFEHEGCKVYRFFDGYSHYFTNCTATLTARSHSCGKNCTRNFTEEIRGSK